MNVSILYESFRYLTRNFENLYCDQLIRIKYTDLKLRKALQRKDIDIIKSIAHLVNDVNIIKFYLFDYAYESVTDNIDIIETILSEELIHIFHNIVFRFACKEGNVDICKRLLVWKPDIRDLDDECFRTVINNGNVSMIKLLIEASTEIRRSLFTTRNIYCLKRMQKSIEQDDHELMKLYIDYNGKIEYIDNLLYTCCYYDSYNVLKLLVESRSITLQNNYYSFSRACENDSYKIVKYLLDNGKLSESTKVAGLEKAIKCEALKVCKMLLKLNIRPSRKIYFDHNNYDVKILMTKYSLI